ncbi:MAG: hypothetical protein C4320_09410 [Armatimonadota bacterium]
MVLGLQKSSTIATDAFVTTLPRNPFPRSQSGPGPTRPHADFHDPQLPNVRFLEQGGVDQLGCECPRSRRQIASFEIIRTLRTTFELDLPVWLQELLKPGFLSVVMRSLPATLENSVLTPRSPLIAENVGRASFVLTRPRPNRYPCLLRMAEIPIGEEATLLDGLSRNWRTLAALTLAGVVVSALVTLVIRPVWEAETTLLVPPPSFSLLNLTTGAGAAGAPLTSSFGGPSILRINKMLLESDRALEMVRKQAGLSGSVIEQRRDLIKQRDVSTEQTANTITLSVRDHDPAQAQKISRLYIKALRQLSRDLNVQKSGREANTVEATLNQKKAELQKAELALQNFQLKARTATSLIPGGLSGGGSGGGAGGDSAPVAVPGDWLTQLRQAEIELANARGTLQSLISNANRVAGAAGRVPTLIPFTEKLRQAVVERETDVRLLANRLGPQAPELLKAERDLNVARDQLAKEVDRYQSSLNLRASDRVLVDAALREAQLQGRVNGLTQLSQIAPKEARQYADLVRRVSLLSGITTRLESQLALSNITRNNDPNAWNVVDDAILGDKPINKSFARNGILGAAGGFLVGVIVCLFLSGRRRPHLRSPLPSEP